MATEQIIPRYKDIPEWSMEIPDFIPPPRQKSPPPPLDQRAIEGNLADPYDPTQPRSSTNSPWYYQTEESMDRFEKYFWEAQRATEEKGDAASNFKQGIKDALENENITTEQHQKLMDDYRVYEDAEGVIRDERREEDVRKKEREMYEWARGLNKTPISLAQGGSLDEQEIMDELLASYGGNEMRAYTPGPFEKQKQTVESFLSGIGQFAEEKDVPFLRALADPSYARNVAGNLSFGTEMLPGVGDVQAIREGAFMMGEGQPKMGAAFIAGSLFTGMSSAQLKKALKKVEQKLEKARTMEYHGQSYMKETNDPIDRRLGKKMYHRSQADIAKHKTEIVEINEALKQDVLKKTTVPPLSKTGRKAATEIPEPKGIINATPETRKLYEDLQRGWKKDLTAEHQLLRKEMSEQTDEFNKFLDEAELDERNQFFQLMLDMKNKKPK